MLRLLNLDRAALCEPLAGCCRHPDPFPAFYTLVHEQIFLSSIEPGKVKLLFPFSLLPSPCLAHFFSGLVDLCLACAKKRDPQSLALHHFRQQQPWDDTAGIAAYNARYCTHARARAPTHSPVHTYTHSLVHTHTYTCTHKQTNNAFSLLLLSLSNPLFSNTSSSQLYYSKFRCLNSKSVIQVAGADSKSSRFHTVICRRFLFLPSTSEVLFVEIILYIYCNTMYCKLTNFQPIQISASQG